MPAFLVEQLRRGKVGAPTQDWLFIHPIILFISSTILFTCLIIRYYNFNLNFKWPRLSLVQIESTLIYMALKMNWLFKSSSYKINCRWHKRDQRSSSKINRWWHKSCLRSMCISLALLMPKCMCLVFSCLKLGW